MKLFSVSRERRARIMDAVAVLLMLLLCAVIGATVLLMLLVALGSSAGLMVK